MAREVIVRNASDTIRTMRWTSSSRRLGSWQQMADEGATVAGGRGRGRTW